MLWGSMAVICCFSGRVSAQTSPPAASDPVQSPQPREAKQNTSDIDMPEPKIEKQEEVRGQQTKRFLWVIPNYRAVSADTYLAPQSF